MARFFSLLLRCCPPLERRLKTRAKLAIECHDLAGLAACVIWGLPVDAVIPMGVHNRRRSTLLGFAAQNLFVEGVDFLLASGANPNARIHDDDGSFSNWQDGKPPLFFLTYFSFGSGTMEPAVRACAVSLLRAGAEVGEGSGAWDCTWRTSAGEDDAGRYRTFDQRVEGLIGNERITWQALVEKERVVHRQTVLDNALPPASVPLVPRARF